MNLDEVLALFGIRRTNPPVQIHENAWSVDGYVFKKGGDDAQLAKSARLCGLLRKQGVAAPEYMTTPDAGQVAG